MFIPLEPYESDPDLSSGKSSKAEDMGYSFNTGPEWNFLVPAERQNQNCSE
jgi:hypothetical protein